MKDHNGQYGKRLSLDNTNEMMARMDHEEDFDIGNIDLTAGNLPNGDARSKYVARAIVNLSLTTAITIAYVVESDATVRTIGLAPCGQFTFANRVTNINSSGSTGGASFKILYKDKAICDGDSHSQR